MCQHSAAGVLSGTGVNTCGFVVLTVWIAAPPTASSQLGVMGTDSKQGLAIVLSKESIEVLDKVYDFDNDNESFAGITWRYC